VVAGAESLSMLRGWRRLAWMRLAIAAGVSAQANISIKDLVNAIAPWDDGGVFIGIYPNINRQMSMVNYSKSPLARVTTPWQLCQAPDIIH
jgi:lysyl-tRNA synthetase class I